MSVRTVWSVIRQRWLLVVVITGVVTVLALGLSLAAPPEYIGETKILVTEGNTAMATFGELFPDLASSPVRSLDTQVELMQMRPILESVIEELDLGMSVETLSKRVSVETVGQTNIVILLVSDEDSERAAELANTLATTYVQWSRDTRRAAIRAAAEVIEERMELVYEQTLQDCLTGTELLAQLRIDEQLETGAAIIVESATPPEDRASPKPVRNTVLGLFLGLVFGCGSAILLDSVDDRIRSSEDAESIYSAPVLGQIHSSKTEGGR